MTLMYLGLFVVSLAVLVKGSDWFVDSSEKIGLSFGISPFIIGVTLVALGTSLPELGSSIASVYEGKSEIVVGNVIGSNVTNILLVLGIVAVISKVVRMDYNIMDVDMPLLIMSAGLLYFAIYDGKFTLVEAVIFLVANGVFLFNSIRGSKKSKAKDIKVGPKEYGLLLLAGVLIFLGSKYTVVALNNLAEIFNIKSGFLALTLLALGTSLPEVVVSATAARKGKAGIAVGNVLGSNIFNTYFVMAIPSFFGELVIPSSILDFPLPFMLATSIVLALICASGRINRFEGYTLLIFYGFYLYKLTEGIA